MLFFFNQVIKLILDPTHSYIPTVDDVAIAKSFLSFYLKLNKT